MQAYLDKVPGPDQIPPPKAAKKRPLVRTEPRKRKSGGEKNGGHSSSADQTLSPLARTVVEDSKSVVEKLVDDFRERLEARRAVNGELAGMDLVTTAQAVSAFQETVQSMGPL